MANYLRRNKIYVAQRPSVKVKVKSNPELVSLVTREYANLVTQGVEGTFEQFAIKISNRTGIKVKDIRNAIDGFILEEYGDILKPGDLT